MKLVEVLVNKSNLREAILAEAPVASPGPGEILVAIDKFALTANNITYAVTGNTIGYWGFFPAPEPWGHVPVWGFANVIESNAAAVAVGTRIWGFFPMASHLIMQPHVSRAGQIIDVAEHRQKLPALYNSYTPTNGDPEAIRAFEDARCLFVPLFATSFIVADYYADNQFFGVDTILIGSASAKTGFGTAAMLAQLPGPRPRVIGLTSPGNADFVRRLGYFDDVVTYDTIETMPHAPAVAYIDMAGSAPITRRVHQHFGDAVKASTFVGATHWEADRRAETLPGAQPKFFFAPSQFGKREADWGAGEPIRRATLASLRVVTHVQRLITVAHLAGGAAAREAYLDLLEGRIPPDRGLMLTLLDEK